MAQLRSRGRSPWVTHRRGWPLTGNGIADDVGLPDGTVVGVGIVVAVEVGVVVIDGLALSDGLGVGVGIGVAAIVFVGVGECDGSGDLLGEGTGVGVGVVVRTDRVGRGVADFTGDDEAVGWAPPTGTTMELL